MIFGILPVFRYHFSKILHFFIRFHFSILIFFDKNTFYIIFILVLNVDEEFVGDAGDE